MQNQSVKQKTKSYTCGLCGKVGNDFSVMAKEPCPKNSRPGFISGHQIPIFGDRS